jgi:hypothetical protein
MSARLLLAMLEPQEKVLFAGGLVIASGGVSAGDTFTAVYAYRGSKQSRSKQAAVSLTVQTLIIDGEPVASANDGTDVLVALSGDSTALINAADDIGWTYKRGRYLRSGQHALTLEKEDTQEDT